MEHIETGRRGTLWSPDGPSADGKAMRYCVDWDDGSLGSVHDTRDLRLIEARGEVECVLS